MISCFLFSLAHVAPIWHPPSPPFELILCQIAQVTSQEKKLALTGAKSSTLYCAEKAPLSYLLEKSKRTELKKHHP